MPQVFYWSPCLTKVGTYKSTINSALSLAKYSNNLYSVNVINICGEWNSEIEFFKKNNIEVYNLGYNYFNLLPKTGYFKTRISYLIIIFLSIFPLLRLLLKKKPDFLIIHLLTALPLIINNIFKLKTKMILRISGFPKLNFFRNFLWKKSKKKLFKIFCPSLDLLDQLIKSNIFSKKQLVFLPDPIIKLNRDQILDLNLDKKIKRNFFISVGRLTRQKNFTYLINEFTKFAKKNLEFDLYIFGEGEEKNKLIINIEKNEMKNRIFLMGYTEHINFYMKKAEAFILTSLWEDPGFVLVEAAQNNLFLISSDCKNGPREILNNGERGLMFKTNQKSALYSKILEYLELKKENKTKSYLISAKKYCKRYTLYQHYKILKPILILN